MITVLPTFRGYTVDIRLKEFRKIYKTRLMDFIPFDSPQGDKLLTAWLKKLPQGEYSRVVSHLF